MHIVPCMLHCFMGVMRKLCDLLISDLSTTNQDGVILSLFRSFNIKLSSDPKKAKETLSERWENSRFRRPEWITILDNINKLLELLPIEKRVKVSIVFRSFGLCQTHHQNPAPEGMG